MFTPHSWYAKLRLRSRTFRETSLSVSPTKANTAASRSKVQSKKPPDSPAEVIIGTSRRHDGPNTPRDYEKSQESWRSELFLASLALVNLVLGHTSITWRSGFFMSHKICLLQQFSIHISFLLFFQPSNNWACPKMPFDVEEVLAKISNGEKAALLSGNYD